MALVSKLQYNESWLFCGLHFRNSGVLCGNTVLVTQSQHLHTSMRICILNRINFLHPTGINYKNKHIWMYVTIMDVWWYLLLVFPCIFQVGDCMLELRKSSCPSCEFHTHQRFKWLKSKRNRKAGVAGRHFLFSSDDRWPDICWLSWRLCALPLSWELQVGGGYNSTYRWQKQENFGIVVYIYKVKPTVP